MSMKMQENLIEAKGLVKSFRMGRKSLLRAVDDVALSIKRGETYALVGESGSGKTTLGRLMLGICSADSGEVLMGGSSICFKGNKERLEFARKAQMVFQDSYASMNPRMKVGDIVAEGIDIHRICTGKERAGRIQELLGLVGLSGDLECRFPHELSGGQRQRVGIARALAVEPEFLVCDEPISSLDVSVQAQIINLLLDLQKKKCLTYLFITHDLNMARHVADRIGVMYKGRIIESGLNSDVWKNPLHPYTRALLSAAMLSRAEAGCEAQAATEEAAACSFAERCTCARSECLLAAPELREIEKGHYAACHIL